jgi:ketosteroid isomerase-like protein
MSEENVEAVRGVRTPVTVSSENRRRRLDERIFVRFPALARVSFSVWSNLPPGSRLRRAWLSRIVRQGSEAANRRDFELLFLGFDPEIELELPESLAGGYVPPDLVGVHRGHNGYRRMWAGLMDVWEDLRLEPEEAIDLGDRLLLAGRVKGHARLSGIPIDQPLFQLFTLRRGLVIRQRDFAERSQAIEAAGLSE